MSDGIGDDLPAAHSVSRTLDLLDEVMDTLLAIGKLGAITKEEEADLAILAANVETFYQKFGERALSEIIFRSMEAELRDKPLH